MSNDPTRDPGPKTDPKQLLEMVLEGMETSAKPRTPPPSSADLAAALPQFEILGLIGQGGMGSVFKAREKKLDRVVALKVLPRELLPDPTFEQRFLREARAQAALSHPNILTVYDFGESDDFFYIASEFIDGVDLRHLMKMDRLSPLEALRLVPQICDALQFAHDRGVVHRDIKPENILIDQDGKVFIADFGLAKMLGTDAGGFTLTRTEQALGTPHYMAPEQMMGAANVDHRADIYALGVVIYEMLTGQLPIGHFAMPSEKAGTRKELDEVVMRALAQAVEERYQSAGEVKSDVQSVGPVTPEPVPVGDQRLCKRPLVGLLIMLFAAIGVQVLVFLTYTNIGREMEFESDLNAYENNQMAIAAHERESNLPWTGERIEKPEDLAEAISFSMFVWPLIGGVSLLLSILVTILGFSGIAAIRESRGRLRGLGLAVFVAWLVPLGLVNGFTAAPLGMIRDQDTWAIVTPIIVVLLLVLDVVFLRWQYGRHQRTIASR